MRIGLMVMFVDGHDRAEWLYAKMLGLEAKTAGRATRMAV
jgi:hypothetical protein